ncbi:MAG: hypothetical protein K2F87_04205 [Muribaculaceae bacterium]|nr:hypothetical protein [Muribaculaceae bacterium]
MDASKFVLYQEDVVEKPLTISIMQPDQNHLVDFKNYPNLEVTFNQDIKLTDGAATITFANRLTGSKETVSSRPTAGGQVLRVPMYSYLKPFMESGAIQTGDEYVVTVSGLTALTGMPYEGADADGNAVFTYLCGSLPVVAVKQTVPEKFLSYWAPGAPEGILSMEFDAPLMDDGKTVAVLGWGNQEGSDGEYYAETIVCDIDGNKLTADFTGKLRTPATMTPMYPDAFYDMMVIDIQNVRDEHGVPVASPGQGTVGSYGFAPTYELISRKIVIAEFSPLSGTMLEDVDNVNIWMTGLDAITFEGFTLTVTDKDNNVSTRTLPLSDVKVSPTGTNEAEYDFTLPADIKNNAKRVEITLAGINSLDGYDHNNDVRCIYGGFAITYAEPANGESFSILEEGMKIMVETNLSEEYPDMFVEYQIIDTNPEDSDPIKKSPAWMERQEDGSYVAELPQPIKLYAGHDYKVEISAWQDEMTRWNNPEDCLGTDFLLWKGLTPAYHYSLLTLTEIIPSTDEMIDGNVKEITAKFDGLVYLGNADPSKGDLRTFINVGSGVTIPFADVKPVQPTDIDGVDMANEWILELPDNYVASLTAPLEISFTAYDQDLQQLRGNMGEEENSFFNFVWNVAGQYDAVTVDAVGDQSPLGNVKEFKVSHENGVAPSWSIPVEEAVVTFNGETVAHVADIVYPDIDFDQTMTEITLVLDTELTENGAYILTIPQDYFTIGEQFEVKSSLAVKYEFTIGNGTGVDAIDAEDTVTVYNAAGILLLDKATREALLTLAPGLYIINGHKVILR